MSVPARIASGPRRDEFKVQPWLRDGVEIRGVGEKRKQLLRCQRQPEFGIPGFSFRVHFTRSLRQAAQHPGEHELVQRPYGKPIRQPPKAERIEHRRLVQP